MQNETISNSQNSEKSAQRQSWNKPDLIDYGTVGDLTQSGGTAGAVEDAYTTSIGG